MTCPKCGHDKESGPTYRGERLNLDMPLGYYTANMILECLVYRCSRCGWERTEPTLEQRAMLEKTKQRSNNEK